MKAKTNVQVRPIEVIANEIRRDWGVKTDYAARPYLKAMYGLNSISDNYLCDSASEIVTRFLNNASTWHGMTARRIKDELKAMLKTK
jgi:hypothetical protein